MRLCGIVTTLNEAANIEACLKSLWQVCDEIIVTDSNSHDDTAEIAERAGAKVYRHHYIGDGPQKNLALPHTECPWVLSIDADERLSDELAAAIRHLDLEHTPYDGFAFRRRNYIGDEWVKCCHWYPDYLVRLFRKDRLRFVDSKQHAYVPARNTRRLRADLIHYRYRSLDELNAKPGRDYSTRGAKILYLKGAKANLFSPYLHGAGAFVANYLFRGGLTAGSTGLILSKAIARNSFMKYRKLLAYRNDRKTRENEDWDSVW